MTALIALGFALSAVVAGLVLYTLANVLVHPNSDGDD